MMSSTLFSRIIPISISRLLCVAVFGPQLRDVLAGLLGQLVQALLDLLVADLDALFLGDLGHRAGPRGP